jgi:hypothetical protein
MRGMRFKWIMIKIEIYEEVENPMELVDLLNEVATLVKKGNMIGYHPGWKIIGDAEPTIE